LIGVKDVGAGADVTIDFIGEVGLPIAIPPPEVSEYSEEA